MTDASVRLTGNSLPHPREAAGHHSAISTTLSAMLHGLREAAALAGKSDARTPQLQLALVNPAFTRLSGFTEGELQAQGLTLLCGADTDAAQLQRLHDAVREQSAARIELVAYCKDGSSFPAELNLTPLHADPATESLWLLTLHDFTGERQARGRVTEMLESTTDSVFALDTDWKFTYLNQRASEDISAGRQLRGEVFWEAFPDTINTPFEDGFRNAMRGQTPVSFEAYYPPLKTWYEVHADPSPRQLTVIFRNINRRKQTGQALLAQQSELAEVQQLARISRWEFDPSRGWITFSANVSELITPALRPEGCAIGDLIQLIHPQDRVPAHRLLTQPSQACESSDLYLRLQVPDHEDRFLFLRAHSAQGPTVRGMVQDATAQKRADLARQSTENRFRLIFESALGGITITTMQGQFIDVNPAFAAMTGYTRDELRSMTFLDLAHPDDRAINAKMAQRLIAGEIPSFTLEKRNITKSGGIVWLRLHVSKCVDELAGTRHLMAIIHDITQQKQAEEALQRSEAQLRQSHKMEAVGRLAGGIAHDFNNLLTVINGYASLLLTELPAADPLRNTIAHIARAGEKAAGLTNQLMVFSRKQVLRATTLDVNQVVAGLEPLLCRLICEDIRLTVQPASARCHVSADLSQLEQVLLNLCINSRDAMPEGGDLTITTETVTLHREDAHTCPDLDPGEYVRLTVRDTGYGMEEATRVRAFEPFFTTRGLEGSCGLGLATVYGVVNQSGGHVSIQSSLGQGTTVQVYLPRVAQEPAAPPQRTSDTHRLGGNETILLAEDEPEIRGFLASILRQNGYQVLSAAHGAEALTLAQEHQGPIHLLASDMIMPGMNGRTLAGQIRESRPETRVLFISGYTDNVLDPAKDLDDEVQFLKKPFTPRALMRAIRALLDAAK